MKIILFVFTGGVGFLTEVAIIQIAISVFGFHMLAPGLSHFQLLFLRHGSLTGKSHSQVKIKLLKS